MNLHQEQLGWGFPTTDGLFAKYCNIQARKFATICKLKSTCKPISLDLCTKWIVANLFTYFPLFSISQFSELGSAGKATDMLAALNNVCSGHQIRHMAI